MKPQLILAVDAVNLRGSPGCYLGNSLETFQPAEVYSLLEKGGLWLGPRETLEKDQSYLQIIPYIVLRDGNKYVRYLRTTDGGEPELHGKVSIGVGGHIDGRDIRWNKDSTVDLKLTVELAGTREVVEEVNPADRNSRETLGLLADFTDDVGMVHIGVVEVWDITGHKLLKTHDKALTDIALATLDELEADRPKMEKWSAHVLDYLQKQAFDAFMFRAEKGCV